MAKSILQRELVHLRQRQLPSGKTTLLLIKGADIYTTSKLMGHKRLRTTQIYAEIIDKKKVTAANLLDDVVK